MIYLNGKRYYNVNEWSNILTKKYNKFGLVVKPNHVHQLFHHYGFKPIKTNGKREISKTGAISNYSEKSFYSFCHKLGFNQTLYNICEYGDARGENAILMKTNNVFKDKTQDVEYAPSYKNNENDMEKHSKWLENNYQTETIKDVVNNYIFEWSRKNTIPTYKDDDKLELVKDNNVVNGGNFPIKRNGKEYWVSRSMSISLYVFCKNKNDEWCVLASLRGPKVKFGASKWNVICGFLDYGYTLEETAVKECFEETGVRITTNMLRSHGVNSSRVRGDVNARFSVVLDGYTDKYPTSIANCEEGEVSEAKWIPLTELNKYNWWNKQGEKALSISQNIINSHILLNNKECKTIVLALQKLVNEKYISNDIYNQIINLLKK